MNYCNADILIADDNADLCQMIKTMLITNGFKNVDTVLSLSEAEKLINNNNYSLIILDVNFPYDDGFSFYKRLSQSFDIPVIFLSARDKNEDRLKGLGLGADDYMVKPIDMSELLMRVRALLRRANVEQSRKIQAGGLLLDADAMSAVLDGEEVPVTTREFNILYKMLSYPNHTFSRAQLMDEFWGVESDTSLRAVDIYITKLRDKFSGCDGFEIKTVRGLGYKAVMK